MFDTITAGRGAFQTIRRCGSRRGPGRVWFCVVLMCASYGLTRRVDAQTDKQIASVHSGEVDVQSVSMTSRLSGYCHDCDECRAYRRRCRQHGYYAADCPPSYGKGFGGVENGAGGAPDAGITAPTPSPAESEVTDFGQLPASFGAAGAALSPAPGMIGDFFGLGGQQMSIESFGQNIFSPTTIPLAGGDRRAKIIENNSPFPVDRVFFNYHHFENAIIPADSTSVPPREQSLNRYTFGLEKTFLDALWSIELRLPFAGGLDSVQFVDPGTMDNSGTEFGNISLALKRLVWQSEVLAASVGLGVVFPTAEDVRLSPAPGAAAQLLIENEAWHLQPFMGLRYTPSDRLWFDFFSQIDFDANGYPTLFQPSPGLSEQGVLNDQNLLFLDASLGYWLYRNPCGCGIVSAIAPMIELHYTTTLQDTDFINFSVGSNQDILTNPFNRIDVLNLTGGLRFQLGRYSFLTVAAAAPLRTAKENIVLQRKEDKLFDSEIGVQFVHLY